MSLTQNAEREKWDKYYETLPVIEEDPYTRALGDEFAGCIQDLLPAGGKTLEAGCGAGWQSLALARGGKYSVSLLDFSSEALSYAREVYAHAGVAADRFLQGNVFEPGEPEYDLVFNAGVLEHYTFDEQVAFLKGMASRSRDYVLVLVPNKLCYWYWLWRIQKVGSGEWPFGKEVPLVDMARAFTASGLAYLGHAFLGASWVDSFIEAVPGIDDGLRHEILEVHRSAIEIPQEQKSYLVAFLGSVNPESKHVGRLWSSSPIVQDMRDAEVNAILADSLALRIGAESQVAQLRVALAGQDDQIRVLERDVNALGHEHDQLRGEHDRLRGERDRLHGERDRLHGERDRLHGEHDRLHGEHDRLRGEHDRLRGERDRYLADLNVFYETKAWKVTYRYWRLRSQGIIGYLKIALFVVGFLLVLPLRVIYWPLRMLYHLLVPKTIRLAFWDWRWRVTHPAQARAANAALKAMKRAAPPTSQTHTAGAKLNVKHLFIFAGVPYYDIGGGQRSSQLAKTFNRMGYPVTYVYGYESSDVGDRLISIPAVQHVYVHDISPRDLIGQLRGEPIFIFEMPHRDFEPYLQLAHTIRAHVIYEHIDNWDTTLGGEFFTPQGLTQFVGKADVVVATTQLLADKVAQFMQADPVLATEAHKVVYCANAVDTDLFDPRLMHKLPNDLVRGDKTLVYYGSLWGEWFDWDLLLHVARACPRCKINLIGDYTALGEKIKAMPKNIHFLGPKKQTELPAYLSHVDIAMLPFRNDEIGKYVSPLKVFEYVAMNVTVLATALPDITDYPNVYTSSDADDWVRFIQGQGQPNEGDATAFAHRNSWYARCDFLLDTVEQTPEQAVNESISVIVLNRNNRLIISRCLESLLAHKRRYSYEILVVDNQSTDGSPELVAERFGDMVLLLRNEKNGCSSGRNLAMQYATGQVLVFLDSDQFALSDRWLDSALHVLRENRTVGAAGWAAGWFNPGSPAGPIAMYLPSQGATPDMLYRTDVAYLGTGGLVMRRETWEATSGFDEFYDPTCFEDTDLSLQMRDLGFELAYCPYINVGHLPHQTTQSGSETHLRLMERNGAYFTSKWRARNAKLLECYLAE